MGELATRFGEMETAGSAIGLQVETTRQICMRNVPCMVLSILAMSRNPLLPFDRDRTF